MALLQIHLQLHSKRILIRLGFKHTLDGERVHAEEKMVRFDDGSDQSQCTGRNALCLEDAMENRKINR